MGGGYWDNKCIKKHIYFTTATQNDSSNNKIDVDTLEHLADKLDIKN